MYTDSPFKKEDDLNTIPSSAHVIFVADFFVQDYTGGAELTTQALIDSVPEYLNVHCIHASKITEQLIESGQKLFWVFGNFATLNPNLIPVIIQNLRYSILEYDYKFCKYRSIEKHLNETGTECDCADQMHGKIVSAFLHGATTVFWMAEKQLDRYTKHYPFLNDLNFGSRQIILSSVFDHHTFAKFSELNQLKRSKSGWLVLKSSSWIKGYEDAVQYCIDNNLEYSEIENLSYEETLDKLSLAEGFVYLPRGGDTCPRMVLEAQLLGCKVIVNDNVQHWGEYPFTGGTLEDVYYYLSGRPEHFWLSIIDDMDIQPRISGYTTTYNCISQKYPYIQSIKSMLGFCEEVVVLDGGSTDGTYEKLLELAKEFEKLVVQQNNVDWLAKRSAVQDGLQKARARSHCTQKYCWQQDSDEILHESHYKSVYKLCRQFPMFVNLIALPVVEYWGGLNKVRMDINPWKWRISRNKPNITHGIPKCLQKYDEDGELYAELGTDGCDYIDNDSNESIPHASFYSPEIHDIRINALQGNFADQIAYQKWFNNVINAMPTVFHYSWFDIERKIKTYRDFWQAHWESLYNISNDDTADNNMFFNKAWSEVSNQDIKELAVNLGDKMGGWIFHSKIDFSNPTPYICVDLNQPELMHDQSQNISHNL